MHSYRDYLLWSMKNKVKAEKVKTGFIEKKQQPLETGFIDPKHSPVPLQQEEEVK
jgi:hypothetical protein